MNVRSERVHLLDRDPDNDPHSNLDCDPDNYVLCKPGICLFFITDVLSMSDREPTRWQHNRMCFQLFF